MRALKVGVRVHGVVYSDRTGQNSVKKVKDGGCECARERVITCFTGTVARVELSEVDAVQARGGFHPVTRLRGVRLRA